MAFDRFDQLHLSQFISSELSPSALWVFVHIPRTAGSSFITEFADLRPNHKALRIDPADEQTPNAKKMSRAVEQFARELETRAFTACSGHIKMTHVRRIRSVEPGAKVITLIRNPVDRVISDFRHARTPTHPPHREFMRKYPTIEDYVDAPDSRDKMSRFLAQRANAESSELLDMIDSCVTFIGLTEMYPMSFNIISRLLGQNRFPRVHKQVTVSTSENAVTVNAALRRRVERNNEADIQLYEHVKAKLIAKRAEWQELLLSEKRPMPEGAIALSDMLKPGAARRKRKAKASPSVRQESESAPARESNVERPETESERLARARVAGLIHRVRWLEHERTRIQGENSRLSRLSRMVFASAAPASKGKSILDRVRARRAADLGRLRSANNAPEAFDDYCRSVNFDLRRLAAYQVDLAIQNSPVVDRNDKEVAHAIRDLFDPDYYVRANDISPAEAHNPLLHYLHNGRLRDLNANPLFDREHYLAQIAEPAEDALLHYCRSGYVAGFSPHPLFDARFYSTQYNGAEAGAGNPLVHYQVTGGLLRLDPSPLFDTAFYLSFLEHPDDIEVPLEHYVLQCRDPGADPHPLFSATWLGTHEGIAFPEAPLVHYLKNRALQFERDPHSLFSLRHLASIGCVSRDDPRSPLEQYLAASIEKDIDPHPTFDSTFYRYQLECERGVKLGMAPILHYLTIGYKDKTLRPHPLFDPAHYLKANRLEGDGPELVRYLSRKDGDGLRCHELFDSRFYDLQRHRSHDNSEMTALEHWSSDGARKWLTDSRLSGPLDPVSLRLIASAVTFAGEFDVDFYRNLYPEFAEYDEFAARDHYENHGKGEGRHGSARALLANTGLAIADVPIGFFPSEYVDLHPDLEVWRGQPMRCLLHYLEHGRPENRQIGYWQLKLDDLRLDIPTHESPVKSRSTDSKCRLCILIHVYYPDLWPELAAFVRNLRVVSSDVFINVADTQWTPDVQAQLRALCPDAFVQVSANRGRDIGGHLRLLDSIDIGRYEAFALLHTKKSRHLATERGAGWRQGLIAAFAGSEETAAQCMRLFEEQPKTGIVGAAAWRANSMNGNQVDVGRLMGQFGIEGDNRRLDFVSGTMFLIRSGIVERLHRELRDIEWEDPTGREAAFFLDGQLEHAVERVIPSLARQMGYQIVWR